MFIRTKTATNLQINWQKVISIEFSLLIVRHSNLYYLVVIMLRIRGYRTWPKTQFKFQISTMWIKSIETSKTYLYRVQLILLLRFKHNELSNLQHVAMRLHCKDKNRQNYNIIYKQFSCTYSINNEIPCVLFIFLRSSLLTPNIYSILQKKSFSSASSICAHKFVVDKYRFNNCSWI